MKRQVYNCVLRKSKIISLPILLITALLFSACSKDKAPGPKGEMVPAKTETSPRRIYSDFITLNTTAGNLNGTMRVNTFETPERASEFFQQEIPAEKNTKQTHKAGIGVSSGHSCWCLKEKKVTFVLFAPEKTTWQEISAETEKIYSEEITAWMENYIQ